MTDNEIIKALERMSAEDADGFSSDILDLIKQQQTEIKQLQIALFKQEETIQLISKEKQEEIAELRVCAENNNDKLNSVIDCQKAVIEELKSNNRVTQRLLSEAWESIEEKDKWFEKREPIVKAEAITEFAERLKATIAGLEVKSPNVVYKGGMEDALYYRMPTIIDQLVKEMTGD